MARQNVQDFRESLSFAGAGKVSAAGLPTSYTDFTASFWIKQNAKTAPNTGIFLVLGTDYQKGFGLIMNENLELRINYRNTGGTTVERNIVNGYTPGVWTKYDIVLSSATGTFVTYRNGVQIDSFAFAGPLSINNNGLTYGGDPFYTGHRLNGLMSQVRFYNVALSAAEVYNQYVNGNSRTNGLLLEHLFNEGVGTTALDTSTGGLNGSITSATYSPDVPSRIRALSQDFKSSLYFSGTNNYVNVANNKIIGGLTNITMVAWVNNISPGSDPFYCERAASGTDILKAELLTKNQGGKLTFTYRDDNNNLTQQSSSVQVLKGVWTHVAIVRNGTNLLFYINGQSVPPEGTALMHASNNDLFTNANIRARIGGDAQDAAASFEGKIAGVRIYNSSLSAAEIASLYNYNTSATPPLGYWKLDEGAGTTVADSGTGGNPGTITNATYSADVPSQKRQTVNSNLVPNGDLKYYPPTNTPSSTNGTWFDGTSAGSVQNGIFRWGIPASGASNGATGSFDPSTSYSGNSAALKLDLPGATSVIALCNATNAGTMTAAQLATIIPVQPNTAYTFTVMCKTNNITANGAYVDLREFNGIGGQVVTTPTNKIGGTNNWTQLTLTFTTASATRYLAILPRALAGSIGTAWYDSFFLQQTQTVSRTAPQDYKASFSGGGVNQSANNAVLDVSTAAGITVAMWLKSTVPTGSNIWQFHDAAGNDAFRLNHETGGRLFTWHVDSSNSGALGFKMANPSPLKQWMRVTVTYNGNGTSSIYINGVLVGSGVSSVARQTANFVIFPNSNGGQSYKDIKIWQRVLTTQEIAQDYAGVQIDTPVARWLLDEGAGSTLFDSGPNGIHMTGSAFTFSYDVPTRKRLVVGANLLRNGDFEYYPIGGVPTTNPGSSGKFIDGTSGGSVTNSIFGWHHHSGGASQAGFDTSVCHSGSASLKLSTLGVSQYAEVSCNVPGITIMERYSGTTNFIPVLPSANYTLTFWMKTNYVSGDSNDGAYIQVIESTGAGATSSNSVSAKIKTTTDWTQYTMNITTNANTRFINIQPRIYGHTGTANLIMDAWFDDIVLTPTVQ